ATECAAPGRLMFQLLRYSRYGDTCIYVMHYSAGFQVVVGFIEFTLTSSSFEQSSSRHSELILGLRGFELRTSDMRGESVNTSPPAHTGRIYISQAYFKSWRPYSYLATPKRRKGLEGYGRISIDQFLMCFVKQLFLMLIQTFSNVYDFDEFSTNSDCS
ncbi:hypothetical protein CLF_111746, partial [Clonorchis sinensis]